MDAGSGAAKYWISLSASHFITAGVSTAMSKPDEDDEDNGDDEDDDDGAEVAIVAENEDHER